jgi:hypothetical protein
MVATKILNFGGMIPALDDTLLPDNAATLAQNTWVRDGTLLGLFAPTQVHTCGGTTRKVFRIPLSENQPYNYSDSFYMEFTDPNTDVIRTPVDGDTYKRYYWASPTDQPRYNTEARILAANSSYKLGIPYPSTAPSVVASGGVSATLVTRTYVTTWVSLYGEESAPSDPDIVTGKIDDTFTVTMVAPTAGELSGRALDKVRIYRTVTGTSGATVYYRVTELAVATLSHADTATDAAITGNPILETDSWGEPPSDLQGFTLMANGILAGFRENEIWFSEPYRPHAWPPEYTLTCDFPIVGMEAMNQSLVVMTRGNPVLVTGTNPAAMSQSKYALFEPCVNRGSIVPTEDGIFYASQNGLVLVAPGAIRVVTQELMDRRQWLNDYNARDISAGRLGNAYVGFGTVDTGIFEPTAWEPTAVEDVDLTSALSGFYIDLLNTRLGVNILAETEAVLRAFPDPWTGDILVIRESGALEVIDPADQTERLVYKWRSKKMQTAAVSNFAAFRVNFYEDPAVDQNPDRTTGINMVLDSGMYGIIRLYADDRLVMARELRKSGEMMRGPSGFKADYWVIEIEARVKVRSIEMASTAKELGSV